MRRTFLGLLIGAAATGLIASGLYAQSLHPRAYETHQQRAEGTARGRRLVAPTLESPQARAAANAKLSAGLFLLFDYNLSRGGYLDLNGPENTTDLGNREYLEGDVWLSNRYGSKIRKIGTVVVTEDFLEVDRSSTGTDLIQTIDMVLFGEGQIRIGGFWNVSDGGGDPLLPVLGASGTKYLRRYGNGQLRFIARPDNDEELFLLER